MYRDAAVRPGRPGLEHVYSAGKIGPIMAIGPSPGLPKHSEKIAGAMEKYKEIDWALDA